MSAGINSVLSTTHRQNYLVPPRSHRCNNALLNMLEVFEFEGIAKHCNALAYGEIVTQTVAQDLRAKIIGAGGQPGLLCWLALHLDPA